MRLCYNHNMMKRHKNLALKIMLGVLCLAIVGLVVGVIVVKVKSWGLTESDISYGRIQDAYESCYQIQAGYTVDKNKLYIEVVEELEAAALKGNEDYYVDYLTCYAQFVFAYGDGFEPAIEILDRANEMVDDLDLLTRSGYYYTYGYFYEAVGDNERAEYYRGLGGQGFDNMTNIGGSATAGPNNGGVVDGGGATNEENNGGVVEGDITEEENNEEVE